MKQGDIFLVDFGINSVGHEYQKRRPALIIESNGQAEKTSLITVLPFSSKRDKKTMDDVLVSRDERNLLLEDSVLKVYNIMSFDKARFYHKIGEADARVMERVKRYLKIHFDM